MNTQIQRAVGRALRSRKRDVVCPDCDGWVLPPPLAPDTPLLSVARALGVRVVMSCTNSMILGKWYGQEKTICLFGNSEPFIYWHELAHATRDLRGIMRRGGIGERINEELICEAVALYYAIRFRREEMVPFGGWFLREISKRRSVVVPRVGDLVEWGIVESARKTILCIEELAVGALGVGS